MNKPIIEPPGWTELVQLINFREKNGFTRSDVSAAMGIAYTYLACMERGCSKIPSKFLIKYKSALDSLIKVVSEQELK